MKLLVSLLLALFISSCNETSSCVDNKSYNAIIDILNYKNGNIDIIIDEFQALHHEYDRGDKYRYGSVTSIFLQTANFLRDYDRVRSLKIHEPDSLLSLYRHLNKGFEKMKYTLIDGVESDYEIFGFYEQEGIKYCDEIRSITLNHYNLELDYLNFMVLEAEFFAKIDELRSIIIDVSGTVYDEYWAFPVVQSGRCMYNRGENVEMKIFLGSYSTSYNTEDVIIMVGNDKLEMNESGYALYKTTADKKGLNKIQLSFEVVNRQTGETTEGVSEYSYRVN